MAALRDATGADIPAIIELGRPVFGEVFPIAGDADRMARMLDWMACDLRGYLRVAEVDGAIVGFLAGMAAPFEPWSDDRCASEVLLYIAPAHRNASLASVMVRAFVEWARQRGCSLVSVSAQDRLDGARVGKLYRRLGFAPQETNYIKRID